MPLSQYVMYQAGYVPHSDVLAQKRCYEVLSKAMMVLNKDVASGEAVKKPELQQLQSVRNLLKDRVGSYGWKNAEIFWQYWDKNKNQIIQIAENGAKEEEYLTYIQQLEDGRYYNQ